MDYVDELDSVPEPEHVELVMDGLIDTVTGNEGFTKAQHYLEAVLFSNGIITHRQVGGTEGILSTIGDGVKATIAYIKKMIRAIWDFFFKTEKKELEEKVDKALDDAYKSLDNLEKTPITTKNVDEVLKKANTVANKIKDEPTKKKVQDEIKVAREAKTPEAKVKAAEGIPEKAFKNYHLYASVTGIASYGIEQNVAVLTKLKEENHFDLGDDIQKIINGLIGLPEKVSKIDGIASAKTYLDKSRSCRTAISNSLKTIENEKATYEDLIKGVEEKIATEPKGYGKNKDELQKLKDGLSVITAIISEAKAILHKLVILANQVSLSCGDPV